MFNVIIILPVFNSSAKLQMVNLVFSNQNVLIYMTIYMIKTIVVY